MPMMAPSKQAASATVRAKGATVSWLCEIGITPARLVRPTVGLMPTTPFVEAGQRIEPSVSVPNDAAARFAAIAAADPELEPQGVRSRTYGLRPCPPRPLQPLDEGLERKLAHSLRFALPRITAPASRSLRATKASRGGRDPSRANEPAVVCIWSAVAILSLRRMGIPCRGPRGPPTIELLAALNKAHWVAVK